MNYFIEPKNTNADRQVHVNMSDRKNNTFANGYFGSFTNNACFKTLYRLCAGVLSACALLMSAQTIYAAEINEKNYDVYYGDVNNDGVSDFYFAGKPSIIILYGDISTPIVTALPKSYAIYGTGAGYADAQLLNLDSSILSQRLASGAMRAAVLNTDFFSWKNAGSDLNRVLLRGVNSNAPSLLLSTSATPILPSGLRSYPASGSANLSDRSKAISIQDQNGDGKLDIVIAGYAYLADIDGLASSLATSTFVPSVTEYSYDGLERVVCTAVRMNPAAVDSSPSDACSLTAEGGFGPDRITQTIFDSASQVREIRQALGTSAERAYARYTYSGDGLKTTEADANNNVSTLEYDGYNRLVKLRYPDTAIGAGTSSTTDYDQYAYDDNGNRTSWRRRDGAYLMAVFDNRNREIQSYTIVDPSRPQTLVPPVYSNYDPMGKLLSKRFNGLAVSNPGVTYDYDSLGRLKTATDMNGKVITYDYNQASARTQLIYPDGQIQPYGLDALNRLTSTGMGVANVTQAYNSLAQLTSVTRGNGAGTSIGYNGAGQPTIYAHNLTGSAYDISWNFVYNPVSQVASVGASSAIYDYKEKVASTENRTYDGLNRDAAIAANGGYDARGNLTNEGSRAFTYDVYNRLVTAAVAPSSTKLVYDPEGRLAKYSTDNGATYTTFLYDGVNLIGEYQAAAYSTPSSTLTRRYLHGMGTDNPLVQINGAATSDASLVRYAYTNYQGSIVALADSSGNKVEVYKYGPYGEPKNENGDSAWAGESRFRYTGQYALPELRLYYYKARVYDPEFGRFLQTDPIGYKDDMDLYAYVGNDPVNMSDPTGEFGVPGMIYGAIAGATGGYIASGDGFSKTAVGIFTGGLAGGVVGFVAPQTAGFVGMATAGAVASATGQALGSAATAAIEKGVTNVKLSDVNVSPTVTAAGAVGAGVGAVVGKGIASFTAQGLIGNTLQAAGTPTAAGLTAGAVVEGAINGAAEKLASPEPPPAPPPPRDKPN